MKSNARKSGNPLRGLSIKNQSKKCYFTDRLSGLVASMYSSS